MKVWDEKTRVKLTWMDCVKKSDDFITNEITCKYGYHATCFRKKINKIMC